MSQLIQLGGHRGQPIAGWTTVDDDDFDALNQHRWSLIDGYARRMTRRVDGGKVLVSMHREILGLVPGDELQADHINRDRLDNRRSNLRVVTHAQNCQNMPKRRVANATSRHRGVRRTREGRWQAFTYACGQFVHLGVFDDETTAGRAAAAARRVVQPFSTDVTL